jgi:glutathione S-transferase
MLEELGLEADIKTYSIRDGSTRSPELLAVSPAGRVPALELGDGTVLFESAAILQVLAERHPDAGLDRPSGHADRARFLEVMGFAETIASQLEMLNMQHLFLRDPTQRSITVMKLNTARLKAGLRALETMLSEQDWLCSGGFSAADIMMGFNVIGAPFYVDMAEFPGLTDYRARIEGRPAYQRARAKDGPQDFFTQDFYPIPEEK